jgi:predicted nucleic acid-binding protein
MLLDTDVMVDVVRNYPPAIAWLMGVGAVGLPGLVAMELLQGCRNLTVQRRLEKQMQQYAWY